MKFESFSQILMRVSSNLMWGFSFMAIADVGLFFCYGSIYCATDLGLLILGVIILYFMC